MATKKNKTPFFHKDNLVLRYCKSKDPELREKIVLSYKPLVEYISKKLAFNKSELDDVIQVGTIGLLRSLERFEPKKQIDFSTFATPNIIGEIKHYFRDKSRLVKVPRKLQELHSKMRTYMRQFPPDQEPPTVSELSKAMNEPEEKILEAMEVGHTSLVLSLDSPSYKSNSYSHSDVVPSLLDNLGVEGKEEYMLKKETIAQAIDKLSAREKKIIYLRFYSGLSQMEIGMRMCLSQMHISRILSKSILSLKNALDPSVFGIMD